MLDLGDKTSSEFVLEMLSQQKNWYFDRDLEVILLIEISGSKVMTV